MTPVILFMALSSCGTMHGLEKPIALVDAPEDLEITNKATGEKLEIKTMKVQTSSKTTKTGYNRERVTVTVYMAPAVKLKPKRNLELELTSGGVTKTVNFKIKRNYGWVFLEGLFTFGVAAVVDLATGGMNDHKKPYIDVSAVMAGTPQRGNRQAFKDMFGKK
jgi:hypothetical protein